MKYDFVTVLDRKGKDVMAVDMPLSFDRIKHEVAP